MKAIRAVIDLFTDYSPERETRKRLSQAKHDLVENECALEYYSASVPMLKARIERLEAEIGVAERAKEAKRTASLTSVQMPTGRALGDFPSVWKIRGAQ